MYSLPTSTTFAVFTIASAASTAPMRPLVSIIPRATNGMRAELYQIAGEGRYAMTIKAFRIRVGPSAVDRRDRSRRHARSAPVQESRQRHHTAKGRSLLFMPHVRPDQV